MNEDPPKSVVEGFVAPEGTPVATFEKMMKEWHAKYAKVVEQGSDERFERLREHLAENLLVYASRVSPVALDLMARTFDEKRSEWAQQAQAAEMEDMQEAHANVSLRYASLASDIGKIQARRS